jgi:hypothetical protein
MDLELYIVGFGGIGQTYFMEFCKNQNIKINCCGDKDKLKHLYNPKDLKVNVKKCIYIYNHPYYSMRSHFRRKWVKQQISKLGNPFHLSKNDFDYDSFEKRVIENKKDMFGIEYHFTNWITANTDFPILFLDFNDILDNTNKINIFLEKELDYRLFMIKERYSYKIENSEVYKIYDDLYKDMKNKIDQKNIFI